LALGLVALFISGEALRIGIAGSLEDSADPSALLFALRLDPANPDLHHRLGFVYSHGRQNINPAEAIKHLRLATELNPHKALFWLSLASACDSVQDTACADQALARALSLTPRTPRAYWIAANQYLLASQTDAALPQFRRLLELSPEYDWPAFRLCLAALGDPLMVLQKVLPRGPEARVKLDYVNFLSDQGDEDLTYRVWTKAVANASAFPFSWAEPYLQHLLDLGHYQEASGVWQDLERLGVVNKALSGERDNLIFNGGFEQAPLNAGFDWRKGSAPYLWVDFAEQPAYQGLRCLRLDFTVGRNEESEPFYQIVPVAPNRPYLLTAYARSEDITSDSGPRLRVLELGCQGCLDVSSETTVGTTPWHRVSLTFSTGAQTQVIRVSVWRPRSRVFPTEITGTFWLDAVSLEPVPPRDSEAKRQKSEARIGRGAKGKE
jgi:hypothetical protein